MFSKKNINYRHGKGFFSVPSLLFSKSQLAAASKWSDAVLIVSSQLRLLVCFVLKLCEGVKDEGRTRDSRKGLAETLSEVKGYGHPLLQGFCFWRRLQNWIVSFTLGSDSEMLKRVTHQAHEARAQGTQHSYPSTWISLSSNRTEGKPRHNVRLAALSPVIQHTCTSRGC